MYGVSFHIHLSLQIHQWKSLNNRSIILIIFFKGKPVTPVIDNEESEINGCKVNVTWSRNFKETPLGIEAKWRELKVLATTFHLLSLEYNKGYEIGVSSSFGKVQSDWSVSLKVKTRSTGGTLYT